MQDDASIPQPVRKKTGGLRSSFLTGLVVVLPVGLTAKIGQ